MPIQEAKKADLSPIKSATQSAERNARKQATIRPFKLSMPD